MNQASGRLTRFYCSFRATHFAFAMALLYGKPLAHG